MLRKLAQRKQHSTTHMHVQPHKIIKIKLLKTATIDKKI